MSHMTNCFDETNSSLAVCHGSGVIVKEPRFLTGGHHKDFGYSFYCTKMESQAIRWCLEKKPKHIVNRYEYTPDNTLATRTFDKISDEWLDFIAACRNGV